MSLEEIAAKARHYLESEADDPTMVLKWREALRGDFPFLARQLSRRLAERLIQGTQMSAEAADGVWRACKTDEAFSHARRVLQRRFKGDKFILPPTLEYKKTPDAPSDDTLREQLALMTSKDPDLSANQRHDWALTILKAVPQTSSGETLGIAGGIYKRRWEVDGKASSLELSLKHYLAPVERDRAPKATDEEHDRDRRGVTAENGYPAINAAFVCDLIAARTDSTRTDGTPDDADDVSTGKRYRDLASSLRTRITKSVKGDGYWDLVTRAEAHLGLREIDKVLPLLVKARTRKPDPWQRDTTARQLARLGNLLHIDDDARRAVAALIGEGEESTAWVESVLVGKVGLALSGGGFRASLYHLGVLACLAESDVLRHIEVISGVSGGSMLAASYYLMLRKKLNASERHERLDYIRLIEDLIKDFRVGTDANLRGSLFTDFAICHAILSGDDDVYAQGMARTVHQTLYSRIDQNDLQMAELAITPKGAPPDFHPRYHNQARHDKVPALVLNAATLSTGHSWQFTTSSMGESPYSIVQGADPLPRLRRSYYRDIHGEIVRKASLAQAVTASACVPGLFAPLHLRGLYAGHTVSLVDGGVYDNQGALALLQEDCTVLLVSDACGQLALDAQPGGGHASPLMRSFNIFQERTRQSTYMRLRDARDAGRLSGLAYVHMKQDLEAAPLDWVKCEDPLRENDQHPGGVANNPVTSYGVWKSHQALLAEIRTDLDVFSDIETAALMASGYMAMNAQMERLFLDVPALKKDRSAKPDWFFEPLLARLRGEDAVLADHLSSGASMFLRITKLDTRARWVVWALVALVVILAAGTLVAYRNREVSVGWIAVAIGTPLVWALIGYARPGWSWTRALVDPNGVLKSRVGRWLGARAVTMVARWLVPRVTRMYLELGRLEKLERKG
jgi:predicted acylesterase/phospholipase RssA